MLGFPPHVRQPSRASGYFALQNRYTDGQLTGNLPEALRGPCFGGDGV